MRVIVSCLVVASLALPVSVYADQSEKEYEEIIVSATRTEKNIDQVLSSASLITKEDIAELQAQNIFQVLSHIPGLNMHQTGATEGPISVFLRGASTGQTLFLLDGQRIGSATLGLPNLALLDPGQIERIEVVRGPRASLYGADAVGGVIHIFTKRAKGEESFKLQSSVGNDLFNGGPAYLSQKHRAGFSANLAENTALSIDVFYENTSGIDDTFSQSGGSDDKDANRKRGINLGLEHSFEKGLFRAQYLFNDVHNEYDSSNGCANIFYGVDPCQPFTDSEVESLNIALQYELSDTVDLSANVGRSVDLNETGDDLNGDPSQTFSISNVFETTRDFATLQTDIALVEEHLLTLGADYYEDRVDGHAYVNGGNFGAPAAPSGYLDENGNNIDSRDNLAFFGQYQGGFGRHHLVAGIREDDNEKYGHNTTRNIAWGIDLTDELLMVLSWGEAFRAPSFNDLYWPDGANPFLEPEESETYELSIKGSYGDTQWQVSYYETDIDNLIEWAPAPTIADPFRWQPGNVEVAEIKGLELQVSTEILSWQVEASYTNLDAKYVETVGNTYDGNRLQGRPEETLKLDVSRRWGDFGLGINWVAESDRTQHKSESPETAGYGVVSVRTDYQLTEELSLQFKVDNLFDKGYTLRSYSYGFFPTVWEDYNTLGRTAFFSVTYKPSL